MGIPSFLQKRYCIEYSDEYDCFRESGFWYTDTGIIVKWVILLVFFLILTLWFVGGYMHAKARLRKGLPLLGYHRFLVPRPLRSYPPQNHFTFYNQQQQQQQQQYPYPYPHQQSNAMYPDPPPRYNGNDAPPGYFAPPGASKVAPNQSVEMGRFGAEGASTAAAVPQGMQQSGVVGGSAGNGSGSGSGDVEAQNATLPPRPPQRAKVMVRSFVDRFRR